MVENIGLDDYFLRLKAEVRETINNLVDLNESIVELNKVIKEKTNRLKQIVT